MLRLTCQIESIDYINGDTRRLLLAVPDGQTINFKAGQYLEIVLPTKNCPFSIASPPELVGKLELHIRPTPNSVDSEQIEALLDTATEVVIDVPKGDCFLEAVPDHRLILIAASTGITQMKSIVEHLLGLGLRHPVHLYWGVLSAQDLYLSPLCESWVKAEPLFHYIPVVSEPEKSPGWTGRTGLVGQIALNDVTTPDDITVYVSGGPGMVYATLDAFVARGMPEANMHSDIFSYAPRHKPTVY